MRFVLFFLFRRFLVKTECDLQKITVTKGIIFTITAVVPLSSIVRITVRRSVFLRLFHAKEVEVFCNKGSVKFFLPRGEVFEPLKPLEKPNPRVIDATFVQEALCAFSDTHALGGIFLFAAALGRISDLLGEEYSEQMSEFLKNLLSDTASNISGILRSAQIIIPRAAVTVGILALAGWAFAFLRKLLSLMHLRTQITGDMALVKCGVLTLYEHTLFLNSQSAVYEQGLLLLIMRRAVLRVRGVIVIPLAERHARFFKNGGFWGHCGVPLTAAAILGAVLAAMSYFEQLRPYELLKTALLFYLIAAIYSAAVRLVYMLYSGISHIRGGIAVNARHSLRLRSADIPWERVVCTSIRRNLFNRSRGNLEYLTRDRLRFKIRQIPLS